MESKINASEDQSRAVNALKAHVSPNVGSVDQSLQFCRKMLGIEPSKVRAGYAKFDVQNPPLNLALNEAPATSRGALSHLGIQLASTEDVLAMKEMWKAAGLATHEEMQTNCCYAVQDKRWVHDPDGKQLDACDLLEDNRP